MAVLGSVIGRRMIIPSKNITMAPWNRTGSGPRIVVTYILELAC
jgi:hypothetical protein